MIQKDILACNPDPDAPDACQIFGDNFGDQDGGCPISKFAIADPVQQALFQPAGYQGITVPWEVAFTPPVLPTPYEFPDTPSAPFPVGSQTLGGFSIKGKYLSIPFVADNAASPTAKHKLEWYRAITTNALVGYKPHPANGVFITISPCMGDFRTSNGTTWPVGDETLNRFCRIYHPESNMYFGENGNCPTEPGRTYFLNMVFADPAGGLDPAETSCDPNGFEYVDGRCDVLMQMRY